MSKQRQSSRLENTRISADTFGKLVHTNLALPQFDSNTTDRRSSAQWPEYLSRTPSVSSAVLALDEDTHSIGGGDDVTVCGNFRRGHSDSHDEANNTRSLILSDNPTATASITPDTELGPKEVETRTIAQKLTRRRSSTFGFDVVPATHDSDPRESRLTTTSTHGTTYGFGSVDGDREKHATRTDDVSDDVADNGIAQPPRAGDTDQFVGFEGFPEEVLVTLE